MSYFITFEGPEGSGKTSVIELIKQYFEAHNIDYLLTREPGGVKISESIRDVILDKSNTAMDPRTEALLYAASRRQHLIEKVWPALKANKLVLCDRYIDSSLAYQGYARNLSVEEVLKINLFATENTFPDLTLLFDLNPEIGLKRIASNKNREVNRLDLEKLDFHHKVRNGYLKLAETYKERFVIIDASLPLEEVYKNALNAILKVIGK